MTYQSHHHIRLNNNNSKTIDINTNNMNNINNSRNKYLF
jgi:hypothetical protein